ncbi:hypothetical protein TorRG33x02_079840, partial [Trema orientale]
MITGIVSREAWSQIGIGMRKSGGCRQAFGQKKKCRNMRCVCVVLAPSTGTTASFSCRGSSASFSSRDSREKEEEVRGFN